MATVEDNTLDVETLALFANAPERFTKRLRREGECVVWTGWRERNGYGRIRVFGEKWSTHRLSYSLSKGEIPDGLYVMHQCDNPPCVNPRHLTVGTALDNRRDAISKGRHAYGERAPNVKLTAMQVSEIRKRYQAGETQELLSCDYDITQGVVSKIIRNVLWVDPAKPAMFGRRLGEQSRCAKITEADVSEIRQRVANGEKHKALAEEYGVYITAIGKIANRKTWKHVP